MYTVNFTVVFTVLVQISARFVHRTDPWISYTDDLDMIDCSRSGVLNTKYECLIFRILIERGIFGEGFQISTNQRRETVLSRL